MATKVCILVQYNRKELLHQTMGVFSAVHRKELLNQTMGVNMGGLVKGFRQPKTTE